MRRTGSSQSLVHTRALVRQCGRQYYCLFVVVSTLTSFLCAFLIKSKVRTMEDGAIASTSGERKSSCVVSWAQVVDTFAVLDGSALTLAKKRL